MAEKRVNVRLAVVGGRKLRETLKGAGDAGAKGMKRLNREIAEANRRLARLGRVARRTGRLAAAAFTGLGVAAVRSSMKAIDAQAKLAQSLQTTTESVQVLTRAGDLAGLSMGEIEQATRQLTRRLSQAAGGAGPAVDALDRLGLSADALLSMPVDARVAAIQDAMADLVPETERAAVAAKIFGDRAGLIFTRIDSDTLRQAAKDVRGFGIAVTEAEADQIERTNDALTRLGLIGRGLGNQLAVAAAPALEALADMMAAAARTGGVLSEALKFLGRNLDRIAAYATAFAGFMASRWVAGLVAAAVSVRGLATALVVLRGALIRTGIGALIVGAGELVYWFGQLVKSSGGFGEAMKLLGRVASATWDVIKAGAQTIPTAIEAVGLKVKAAWLKMLAWLREKWAGFLRDLGTRLSNTPLAKHLADDVFAGAMDMDARASALRVQSERLSGQSVSVQAGANADVVGAWERLGAAMRDVRVVMRRAGEDADKGLDAAGDAVDRINDLLEDVPAAAAPAGDAGRDAGDETATGWAAAIKSLEDYAARAKDTGAQIGKALVGAFQNAESAVAEFVRGGKVSIRDFASSIAADFAKIAARRYLFSPLASLAASVLHSGGVAGAGGQTRAVPAVAFTGAPRLHSGGVAGLKPDEVPTILQRGERVLSRRETREYGRRGDAPVIVNIEARDAESFRRSQAQIAADIGRAVSFGRRVT